MSRLWAEIHFRSDLEAGWAIGRHVGGGTLEGIAHELRQLLWTRRLGRPQRWAPFNRGTEDTSAQATTIQTGIPRARGLTEVKTLISGSFCVAPQARAPHPIRLEELALQPGQYRLGPDPGRRGPHLVQIQRHPELDPHHLAKLATTSFYTLHRWGMKPTFCQERQIPDVPQSTAALKVGESNPTVHG